MRAARNGVVEEGRAQGRIGVGRRVVDDRATLVRHREHDVAGAVRAQTVRRDRQQPAAGTDFLRRSLDVEEVEQPVAARRGRRGWRRTA